MEGAKRAYVAIISHIFAVTEDALILVNQGTFLTLNCEYAFYKASMRRWVPAVAGRGLGISALAYVPVGIKSKPNL